MFDDNNQTLNTSTVPAPADPATPSDTTAPALPTDQAFNTSALPADTATPVVPADPIVTDTPSPAAPSTPTVGDDLMSIKQDALKQLTPLLSHLDQTPEEKFRTTMMLIQASDDQSLVQTAYASAKEISDEKIRAQAILDIVNEINYFTQAKGTVNPANPAQ